MSFPDPHSPHWPRGLEEGKHLPAQWPFPLTFPLTGPTGGQIRAEPLVLAFAGIKLYIRGRAGVHFLAKQPQKLPWLSRSWLCPCSFLHPRLCLLGVRSAQHLFPEHLLCVRLAGGGAVSRSGSSPTLQRGWQPANHR